MKIREMVKEERPREKLLLFGRQALTNAELLAILIKNGSKKKSVMDIAEELLHSSNEGIKAIAQYSPEELAAFEGIGIAKACTILAAVELGNRVIQKGMMGKDCIETVEDVANILIGQMSYLKKEIFRVLLLDARGGIISNEIVSVGDLISSPVHPRESFVTAIKRSAAAVIFAHNHPSGDPSPSDEDIQTTKRLKQAGEILGIEVLDHIIVGDGTYVSFKAIGLI